MNKNHTVKRMWVPLYLFLFAVCGPSALLAAAAQAEEEAPEALGAQAEGELPEVAGGEAAAQSAPVVADGRVLFSLRGIPSYPATLRAQLISSRIEGLAADETFSPEKLTLEETDEYTKIMFGEKLVMAVHKLDASAEGVSRPVLAGIFKDRIIPAVRSFRDERSLRSLLINAGYATGAAILLFGLLFLVWRFARHQDAWIENRYRSRVQNVQARSYQLVQAKRLWEAVRGLVQAVRTLVTLVLALACAEYVLGLFPWTRLMAAQGLDLILAPLRSIGEGVIGAVPGLLFIAVLAFVLRYVLKLLRLFLPASRVEGSTCPVSTPNGRCQPSRSSDLGWLRSAW